MAKKIDHDQRKREVAQKALRLFSKVGYDNVSLIMIAAAAGVPRTVLYRYFCSKREVMDAAILEVTGAIESRCREVLLTKASASEKLEKVCHAVVEEMFANREFVIAVFDFVVGLVRTGVDLNASIHEYTKGTRNAIRMLVAHGKRQGVFPSVLIEERTTDAIYAEFESCAMRIVLNTERDTAQAKQRFSDVVRAITVWK